MMILSVLFKILFGLAVMQCSLAVADVKLKALRNYLKMASNQEQQLYPAEEDSAAFEQTGSHELVRRLPPLVPPSFNDEEHFDERQVFHIPRVGKRLQVGRSDLITLSDRPGESSDSSKDDRFFGNGRREVRQVFSKIPRVGRSSRSLKQKE